MYLQRTHCVNNTVRALYFCDFNARLEKQFRSPHWKMQNKHERPGSVRKTASLSTSWDRPFTNTNKRISFFFIFEANSSICNSPLLPGISLRWHYYTVNVFPVPVCVYVINVNAVKNKHRQSNPMVVLLSVTRRWRSRRSRCTRESCCVRHGVYIGVRGGFPLPNRLNASTLPLPPPLFPPFT